MKRETDEIHRDTAQDILHGEPERKRPCYPTRPSYHTTTPYPRVNNYRKSSLSRKVDREVDALDERMRRTERLCAEFRPTLDSLDQIIRDKVKQALPPSTAHTQELQKAHDMIAALSSKVEQLEQKNTQLVQVQENMTGSLKSVQRKHKRLDTEIQSRAAAQNQVLDARFKDPEFFYKYENAQPSQIIAWLEKKGGLGRYTKGTTRVDIQKIFEDYTSETFGAKTALDAFFKTQLQATYYLSLQRALADKYKK
jgi:DNA repair exonuclease SbcCD ATPase subunit